MSKNQEFNTMVFFIPGQYLWVCDIYWLYFSVFLSWKGEYSVQTLVISHLKRHRTFVNLAHKNQVSINVYEGSPLPTSAIEMNNIDEVMSLAVVPMGISMYRNHLVCRLANVCLLAASFGGFKAISLSKLQTTYLINRWHIGNISCYYFPVPCDIVSLSIVQLVILW